MYGPSSRGAGATVLTPSAQSVDPAPHGRGTHPCIEHEADVGNIEGENGEAVPLVVASPSRFWREPECGCAWDQSYFSGDP